MAKIFHRPWFWLGIFLFIGAFLRFYRLPEYVQFLGDQGRDVLVVERMIVDGKWTLLGPSASVGGFYTGPIYYYMILPFLWLFQLDPIGPVVFAALLGTATIALIFFFLKSLVDTKSALIGSFLVVVSARMIDISRFSWNPNPIPFFAIAMAFCLYLAAIKNKPVYPFLAGISIGVLLQLHYTDLALIPVAAVSIVLLFRPKNAVMHLFSLGFGTLLGLSPFLLFEVRHGYPNIRSVIEFITRKNGAISVANFNPVWQFYEAGRRTFEATLTIKGNILQLFYLPSVLGFIIWCISAKDKLVSKKILLSWAIIGTLAISTYRSFLTDHYFSSLYPLPFIFIAITGTLLLKKKILWPVLVAWLSIFFFFQIQNGYFQRQPNNLIEKSKETAKIVEKLADNKPFNFALGSLGNSDHAYRYFLEVDHKIPVMIDNMQNDPEKKTVTDQLIVVCEGDCSISTNPAWEIVGFGPAQIVSETSGPAGIKVFKLIHYKSTPKLKVGS